MKSMIAMLYLTFPLVLAAAWPSAEDMALFKARKYGAQVEERLQIVDQDGSPVANATVWGGLQTGDGHRDFIPINGSTDTNGEFIIRGKCTNRIRCDITKDGYYASEFLLTSYGYKHSLKDGKWQPYGGKHTIMLKKIKSPIAMSHFRSCNAMPPSFDEWYGYDIERRKWVNSADGGGHADMLVKISIDAKNEINDFKAVMEVSFTNNPFAGAYMLKKDAYSEMKSVYVADTNALYQTSFRFVQERHPNIVYKPVKQVSGTRRIDTRLAADSYLVFRTRTKVDSEGRLLSAHYGKIYGLWEFFGGMCAEDVKFNPTPNDPNLEDEETARYSEMCARQRKELRSQKIDHIRH